MSASSASAATSTAPTPPTCRHWSSRSLSCGPRRERPHPGAQLSLFDQDEGLRHHAFLTDTPYSGGGSAQFLEVRHRGHATVEDHIRCGKTTGLGRFRSRNFGANAVWLELSLAAIGLLAWTRVLLLDGELAPAEPKKLRHRLLHVAARLTRAGPPPCPLAGQQPESPNQRDQSGPATRSETERLADGESAVDGEDGAGGPLG
ncbi:hypothetical protein RKD29_007871 [Streptomyces tendae]